MTIFSSWEGIHCALAPVHRNCRSLRLELSMVEMFQYQPSTQQPIPEQKKRTQRRFLTSYPGRGPAAPDTRAVERQRGLRRKHRR
jgi:hypothetical protein